jgi:hypothetical protein
MSLDFATLERYHVANKLVDIDVDAILLASVEKPPDVCNHLARVRLLSHNTSIGAAKPVPSLYTCRTDYSTKNFF